MNVLYALSFLKLTDYTVCVNHQRCKTENMIICFKLIGLHFSGTQRWLVDRGHVLAHHHVEMTKKMLDLMPYPRSGEHPKVNSDFSRIGKIVNTHWIYSLGISKCFNSLFYRFCFMNFKIFF